MEKSWKYNEIDMKWSNETQGDFQETIRYVRLIPPVVGSELHGHFAEEVSFTKRFVPLGIAGISNVRCQLNSKDNHQL